MLIQRVARTGLFCLLCALACDDDDGPWRGDGGAVDAPATESGSPGRDDAHAPDAVVTEAGGDAFPGGGGTTGNAGAAGTTPPADPVCAAADRAGFFSNCSACPTSNCDSLNGKAACGCDTAADCPCGLRCGCHQLAPNVRVCGLCVR